MLVKSHASPRRKFGATQKDRIFFACLPDAETADRIHALAETLKHANRFDGTLILPNHLHVTLFHLGEWNGLPAAIIKAAEDAAAEVDVPAFDVAFNLSQSFRSSTGIYPFVLTGDKAAAAWRPLHVALGAALRRVGLGGATHGNFTPHVTLLYDEERAASAPIEPISWTVRDFVLVHSLLGKTTHIHLGRWPLRG
jgi:2'-5' RNA ligase